MPNIEDLGKQMKKRFPGKWDHLSDIELGSQTRATAPEYAHYEDMPEVGITVVKPAPRITDPKTKPELLKPNLIEDIQVPQRIQDNFKVLEDYYNPTRGRISSWWQRGKAEGRAALEEVLTREQAAVLQRAAMLEKAIREGQKSDIDFKVFVAQNYTVLLELQAKEILIEAAIGIGLPMEHYTQLRFDELTQELRLREKANNSDIDYADYKRRIELELEADRQRGVMGLDVRWKEIVQELDAADLLEISGKQVNKKLRDELIQARRDRYEIEKGKDPKRLKEVILGDCDRFIHDLEDRLKERMDGGKQTAGLLPAKNWEED